MSTKLVRIKKVKGRGAGDHMMVTPEYAAKTKMLKNSGWVVEDLPESKEIINESAKGATFEKSEIGQIIKDTFDEALTEKETGLSLEDQPEEIVDLLEVKEESKPKTRGRQKGSKNK